VASVYDRSGRLVGEVTRSGTVYDTNQRRVGQVTGVGSVSTSGDLEDASGRHVGQAIGMNSASVTADIYDRNDNYVGKVTGLRSAAGSCSIENRNGDPVGEVRTTDASAVGAALLLLPPISGPARREPAAPAMPGNPHPRITTPAHTGRIRSTRPNRVRTAHRRPRANADAALPSSGASPSWLSLVQLQGQSSCSATRQYQVPPHRPLPSAPTAPRSPRRA
jgi:YD repeat-containing protein